jgi:hypothetical protein
MRNGPVDIARESERIRVSRQPHVTVRQAAHDFLLFNSFDPPQILFLRRYPSDLKQSLFIGTFKSLNAVHRALSISKDESDYGSHEK